MDPSSLSNPQDCKVSSLKLVLTVNFEKSQLQGYVEVFSQIMRDGVESLILDTNKLEVTNCIDLTSNPINFKIGEEQPNFGKPLIISIPESLRSTGKEFSVRVYYNTTAESNALQWLNKEQTAGKEHPYLFSQCQAIHARSLVPCQDSPSNKVKYQAEITVAKPLTALMSALSTGKTETADNSIYSFTQEIPIPTYLIAIVVGNLESREIGPRSKVWSEPSMVEAAAYEFANTERFIATGEDLLTPYVWGRYDILLLPPSFPYGGMENPLLTFVTPTLLAGDRSLENVVAHEIAHSWCGNLVTNRFWSEFFLNEGFTVFVERKIIARLYGEEMFDFEAMNGLKHLHDDVEQFKKIDQEPLTALKPNLDGIDPDDAFSSVPYEKGFNLLCYLQSLVGVADFEAWLKSYIAKFSYQSIIADQMKDYFIDYFTERGKADAISVVDWDSWFNKPGMPINQVLFVSEKAQVAKDLAEITWSKEHGKNATENDLRSFKTQQIVLFLDTLLNITVDKPLPTEVLEKMDSLYHLTEVRNSEYKFRWQSLCLQHGLKRIEPHVVDFLTSQGRMKFVRPLYRELNKVNPQLAKDTFIKHKSQYHIIASKMVSKDLGLN
ncbi:leukotriene A4 hydrolase [Dictyostelium purpureum]|uniref:Leukotriene A4 hydrolase n=1 Tax=Dictyostelium purpureum TaxID=5786 RepID=F1A1D9_DICPU|nr:leukotriene A4 hydrolase [Dictyostelium purpureum]EGC29991.1 leukotriene A4 hydrolase [Dictyostelium purpureum]|eukprot:XP_003293475.1 leukotriene A4 hydrolase [Dictyostelium purpureum]